MICRMAIVGRTWFVLYTTYYVSIMTLKLESTAQHTETPGLTTYYL